MADLVAGAARAAEMGGAPGMYVLREGDPRGTQVFVRYMDAEGATTQVTRVDKAPADLRWSPDSKTIAFTMSVQERASPTSRR